MDNQTPDQKTNEFIEGIDDKNVALELWKSINEIYGKTAHLVNYRFHSFLYRSIKKGYITMDHACEIAGFSKTQMYHILSKFERREMERRKKDEPTG